MSDQTLHMLAFILTMAAATFATRALPFVVLRRQQAQPWLHFAGRYLPPAIMLLLLIYCLKDIAWWQGKGLHEALCLAVVCAAHLLWRHALVSILLGTGLFMLLEQGVL